MSHIAACLFRFLFIWTLANPNISNALSMMNNPIHHQHHSLGMPQHLQEHILQLSSSSLLARTPSDTTDISSHEDIGQKQRSSKPISNKKAPSPITAFWASLSHQYQQRIAADSAFLTKSIVEIIIAASAQFMAEINRRGIHRLLPEFDFVFAAILTAIIGKYYSMWRVAPTLESPQQQKQPSSHSILQEENEMISKQSVSYIPNNAFQSSSSSEQVILFRNRIYAFLLPMPSLFQAGFFASLFGYGLTNLFIQYRSFMFPHFVSQTQPVNIWGASLFTGAFVALVSNVRYQVLQGIIEPRIIDSLFRKHPITRRCMIFVVRYANGILGSMLAIMGMRRLGLQKLA